METIEKNGEFEKYVDMLDEREQKERRDLRRRKRERKRVEEGDHYISDEESEEEQPEESYDSEEEYDESESVSTNHKLFWSYLMQSVEQSMDGGADSRGHAKKSRMAKSHYSDGFDMATRFNALRFLAMSLKSQNNTMKPRDYTSEHWLLTNLNLTLHLQQTCLHKRPYISYIIAESE